MCVCPRSFNNRSIFFRSGQVKSARETIEQSYLDFPNEPRL